MPETATAPQATRTSERVPEWAVWSLRILVLAVAILVFGQPVLAGLFVTGDVGMLESHSMHATYLLTLAFFQIIAAILVWRPGGGPTWPIWASLAFFVIAELQAGFGYARLIAIHIPLGVALFGMSVLLVAGTWSARIRVRRSPKTSTGTGE